MDVLRTAPRTPSPAAAAALERLAAIITQRGRATRAADVGTRVVEPAATGTQTAESRVESDGASRAWPGGDHACDAHRPGPETRQGAAAACASLSPAAADTLGEHALVSPDVLVMACRGVHEFIGLIDDTRELERLARIQLEGTDGTSGDVGRDVGCRGIGSFGGGDAAIGVTPGNDGAPGRGHTGGVPRATRTDWSPPLTFATWLAWRVWQTQPRAGIVWVGRAIWPGVSLLHRCPGLMNASLLVDCDRSDGAMAGSGSARSTPKSGGCRRRSPPTASSLELRVWAAEQAIRSGACSLVVADGSGFSRVMTQRLQLAAESGYCSCVLLRRPREVRCLSAANTRWLVHRAATCESTGRSEAARPRHVAMNAKAMASELVSELANELANELASADVWSTGWIARLWRSKGASPVSMQMANAQTWLLRMVYRADDLSRFNDAWRNAHKGQHRLDADGSPSGFDLVPVLAHRSAQASDAASPRERRAAG